MVVLKIDDCGVREQPGSYAVASAVHKPYCCYAQVPDLAAAIKIARAVIDLGIDEAPVVYRVNGKRRKD